MNDWKSKASFITPIGIESPVNGKPTKFFAISVETAFKIRKIGGELAGAFGLIFTDTRADSGSLQENFPLDAANKDMVGTRTQVEPVSTEIAKLRAEQRTRGLMGLFDAIMSEENKNILGEIVMESLHEVFPPDSPSDRPPVKEFLSKTPLPAFTELCLGVFLANKGVFGPFVTQAQSLLKSAFDAALAKLEERKTTPAAETRGSS